MKDVSHLLHTHGYPSTNTDPDLEYSHTPSFSSCMFVRPPLAATACDVHVHCIHWCCTGQWSLAPGSCIAITHQLQRLMCSQRRTRPSGSYRAAGGWTWRGSGASRGTKLWYAGLDMLGRYPHLTARPRRPPPHNTPPSPPSYRATIMMHNDAIGRKDRSSYYHAS